MENKAVEVTAYSLLIKLEALRCRTSPQRSGPFEFRAFSQHGRAPNEHSRFSVSVGAALFMFLMRTA